MDSIRAILELGGPVVALLLLMSVIAGAVVIYKLWQFQAAGVGRHQMLGQALERWDIGQRAEARQALAGSRSYLVPLVESAMSQTPSLKRLEAEAGLAFAHLEGGFRLLDTIAQLAPLLGLFGTVLGMIDAFQSLQSVGSSVDPALLAGGIWVALLTTAVGLAVAMPVSMMLAWFESRMARERVFADRALQVILVPEGQGRDLADVS